MEMPFDVAVEGTGNPDASVAHVLAAIEQGKHVVMVTKESDSVAGPLLARKAAQAGLIYSLADGDQPALLISLVTWAETAGLNILSIGKASEYDFIYDERNRAVSMLESRIEREATGLGRGCQARRRARARASAAHATAATIPRPPRAPEPGACVLPIAQDALSASGASAAGVGATRTEPSPASRTGDAPASAKASSKSAEKPAVVV